MFKRLLVVIVMALSTLGTTTLVATPSASASTATFANEMETAIHKYTNAQRRANGRRAVVYSSCVDRYAEGWAAHLATTGGWYHRDWRVIVRGCNKRYASENIAKYSTGASADAIAKTIVRMWMASRTHRINLLSSSARTMGVGVKLSSSGGQWYVVQNFAS